METVFDIKALADEIISRSKDKAYFIVAIEGRCASGKTTLTEKLREYLCCNVVHADDFFLQSFQRTEERLSQPGGNLDRERLLDEVILPISQQKDFFYRPFDCKTMSIKEGKKIPFKQITVIEGAYTCHPELEKYYGLKLFADVDKNTQKDRILKRNGDEKLKIFLDKWIPMEEKYFLCYDIYSKADIIISL